MGTTTQAVPPPNDNSDLTVTEACAEMRVSRSTVWRLLAREEIDGYAAMMDAHLTPKDQAWLEYGAEGHALA